MEAPSSKMLPVLVTWYIVVACLIQSNNAMVCYLRSHMGYGGCIRWFLPAKEIHNCTAMELGGYSTVFYKRSQIIEFSKPFISNNADDIQHFVKEHGVTTSQGNVFDSTGSPEISFSPTSDQHFALTSDVTTFEGDVSDSSSNTKVPFSSTTTVRDTTYPTNFNSGELRCFRQCNVGTFSSCGDSSACICTDIGSRNTTVKILTAGCNNNATGTFIPVGFNYFNGTKKCYCDINETLVCKERSECDSYVELERWTCQIGDKNETFFKLPRPRPSGCHELSSSGVADKGIYCVYPKSLSNSSVPHLKVYCDRGWTVIQRRVNGSVDFYRNWTEYKEGFGILDHEFWLGNENIYHLTKQAQMQLRIDLQNDRKYKASYDKFRIGREDTNYRLLELGDFTDGGVEIDALTDHVNASFSTHDRDMDLQNSENCAEANRGGWWFTNCHSCYLNGVYGESTVPGIRWYGLPRGLYNIKSTEMKIRPK